MTSLRRLVVSALLALALGAVLVPSAPADAATVTASAPATAKSTARLGTLIGDTERGAAAPGTRSAIRPWRGRTLTYYDALPAAWSWSLTKAVGNWNAAGGRIHFVPTTNARKAKVTISFGDTAGASGMATVGMRKKAWVHLSTTFVGADATQAWNRVAVMEVLTHELGHVLGFEHVTTPCALMNPVIDVSGCGMLPDTRPGYYKCRVIDPTLEQAFVGSYAGHARYPSAAYCLIDPLPTAVTGVQASTDASSDVHVTWRRPAYAPAGSTIQVQAWSADSCGAVPLGAASINLPIGQTSFGYVADATGGQACLKISAVNRYGAASAVASRSLARVAPAAVVPAP